jgi:hypothetical protein
LNVNKLLQVSPVTKPLVKEELEAHPRRSPAS